MAHVNAWDLPASSAGYSEAHVGARMSRSVGPEDDSRYDDIMNDGGEYLRVHQGNYAAKFGMSPHEAFLLASTDVHRKQCAKKIPLMDEDAQRCFDISRTVVTASHHGGRFGKPSCCGPRWDCRYPKAPCCSKPPMPWVCLKLFRSVHEARRLPWDCCEEKTVCVKRPRCVARIDGVVHQVGCDDSCVTMVLYNKPRCNSVPPAVIPTCGEWTFEVRSPVQSDGCDPCKTDLVGRIRGTYDLKYHLSLRRWCIGNHYTMRMPLFDPCMAEKYHRQMIPTGQLLVTLVCVSACGNKWAIANIMMCHQLGCKPRIHPMLRCRGPSSSCWHWPGSRCRIGDSVAMLTDGLVTHEDLSLGASTDGLQSSSSSAVGTPLIGAEAEGEGEAAPLSSVPRVVNASPHHGPAPAPEPSAEALKTLHADLEAVFAPYVKDVEAYRAAETARPNFGDERQTGGDRGVIEYMAYDPNASSFAPSAQVSFASPHMPAHHGSNSKQPSGKAAEPRTPTGPRLWSWGTAARALVALAILKKMEENSPGQDLTEQSRLEDPAYLLEVLGEASPLTSAIKALYKRSGHEHTPSVAQLLLHTSGLPDFLPVDAQRVVDDFAQQRKPVTPADEEVLAEAMSEKVLPSVPMPPGAVHLPSMFGYAVLGAFASKLYKAPLEKVVISTGRDMGLLSLTYDPFSDQDVLERVVESHQPVLNGPYGLVAGDVGLFGTLEDLVRFGSTVLGRGMGRNRVPAPEAAGCSAIRAQRALVEPRFQIADSHHSMAAYGDFTVDDGSLNHHRLITLSSSTPGGHSLKLFLYPDQDITVAYATDDIIPSGTATYAYISEIPRRVADAVDTYRHSGSNGLEVKTEGVGCPMHDREKARRRAQEEASARHGTPPPVHTEGVGCPMHERTNRRSNVLHQIATQQTGMSSGYRSYWNAERKRLSDEHAKQTMTERVDEMIARHGSTKFESMMGHAPTGGREVYTLHPPAPDGQPMLTLKCNGDNEDCIFVVWDPDRSAWLSVSQVDGLPTEHVRFTTVELRPASMRGRDGNTKGEAAGLKGDAMVLNGVVYVDGDFRKAIDDIYRANADEEASKVDPDLRGIHESGSGGSFQKVSADLSASSPAGETQSIGQIWPFLAGAAVGAGAVALTSPYRYGYGYYGPRYRYGYYPYYAYPYYGYRRPRYVWSNIEGGDQARAHSPMSEAQKQAELETDRAIHDENVSIGAPRGGHRGGGRHGGGVRFGGGYGGIRRGSRYFGGYRGGYRTGYWRGPGPYYRRRGYPIFVGGIPTYYYDDPYYYGDDDYYYYY